MVKDELDFGGVNLDIPYKECEETINVSVLGYSGANIPEKYLPSIIEILMRLPEPIKTFYPPNVEEALKELEVKGIIKDINNYSVGGEFSVRLTDIFKNSSSEIIYSNDEKEFNSLICIDNIFFIDGTDHYFVEREKVEGNKTIKKIFDELPTRYVELEGKEYYLIKSPYASFNKQYPHYKQLNSLDFKTRIYKKDIEPVDYHLIVAPEINRVDIGIYSKIGKGGTLGCIMLNGENHPKDPYVTLEEGIKKMTEREWDLEESIKRLEYA